MVLISPSTTNSRTLQRKFSPSQKIEVEFTYIICTFNIHNEILWCEWCVGADVIIDFVGASYWENHTQCVAVDGRIVLLGLVYI